MKRTLVTVLGSAALLVAVSPAARADAFLSLSSNGVTVSCNTALAFNAGNCGANFTAVANGNQISFGALGGVIVGGYKVVSVDLTSNQPGNSAIAFAADTKSQVQNISANAGTMFTVNFAVNGYTAPNGTTLTLNTSQSGTFTNAGTTSSQAFSGAADAVGNSLTPMAGTTESTPNCVSTTAACSTVGSPTNFARTGNFALSGSQNITLLQGPNTQAGFTAQVNATNVVPEPGSLVLLATGFIGLVGGRRVWRRKA